MFNTVRNARKTFLSPSFAWLDICWRSYIDFIALTVSLRLSSFLPIIFAVLLSEPNRENVMQAAMIFRRDNYNDLRIIKMTTVGHLIWSKLFEICILWTSLFTTSGSRKLKLQIMSRDLYRHAILLHRAKFRWNRTIGCLAKAIFNMAAVRHLEFSKFAVCVKWPPLSCYPHATFHWNRTIGCWDSQKKIFNMAAVRHLEFKKNHFWSCSVVSFIMC